MIITETKENYRNWRWLQKLKIITKLKMITKTKDDYGNLRWSQKLKMITKTRDDGNKDDYRK